jgi:acyl carrier protein
MSTTQEPVRELVARAIRRVVPDADLRDLPADADLRQQFELDSLDFLGFVEELSQASGVRLDEDDYPDLGTLAGCETLFARRAT